MMIYTKWAKSDTLLVFEFRVLLNALYLQLCLLTYHFH